MPSPSLLAALSQIGSLKRLPRSGWVREGVTDPESVAGHSFRTAVLALTLGPDTGVDTAKLVQMALVHDLAESDPTVGDITPFDGISREEKHRREQAAIDTLCAVLPNGAAILALWNEAEEGKTPEAVICKELDMLEMALQAREYEQAQGKDLTVFLEWADGKIRHPALRKIKEML